MTKILKFVRDETSNASPFGRDALETFPDKEIPVPAFSLVEEEPDIPEEEEIVLDPEVIRAEIMAEARDEAARKVQEAYNEGLERGTAAGREAFDKTLAECADALMAAGDSIQTSYAEYLDSLERQVVDLVRRIATKVVEVEISSNPEVLQKTVRRALSLISESPQVNLALNPADVEAIQVREIELLKTFPGIESLTLKADESVSPGGCEASTKAKVIDARLETILAEVLDSLTE